MSSSDNATLNKPASPTSLTNNQRLDFIWIELTNACNLNCGHCYAGSSPLGGRDDRLTTTDYFEAISSAHQHGCRKVQFIGGEATLHPDLPEMISLCRELGYEFIEVFTNLISLPEKLLTSFIENNVAIATSFYSAKPSVHDQMTARNGSWDRTVENLKRVLASNLDCRAGIIISEVNEADVQDAEKFLQELGVTNIGRDRVRAFGRAANDTNEQMAGLCGSCAGDVICIGYDGRVSPCIMSKKWSVGSLEDQPLEQILTSSKRRETREAIYAATYEASGTHPQMGGCNPDCTPCSPKSNDTCTPKTMCYPQHTPNCSPKY